MDVLARKLVGIESQFTSTRPESLSLKTTHPTQKTPRLAPKQTAVRWRVFGKRQALLLATLTCSLVSLLLGSEWKSCAIAASLSEDVTPAWRALDDHDLQVQRRAVASLLRQDQVMTSDPELKQRLDQAVDRFLSTQDAELIQLATRVLAAQWSVEGMSNHLALKGLFTHGELSAQRQVRTAVRQRRTSPALAAPTVADLLRDQTDPVLRRGAAIMALSLQGDAGPCITWLIKGLRDQECRETMADALLNLGPLSPAARQELESYLLSDEPSLSKIAAELLAGQTTAASIEVIASLFQHMEHADLSYEVKHYVSSALRQAPAEGTLLISQQIANWPQYQVAHRERICRFLAQAPDLCRPLISQWIDLMKSDESFVTESFITLLGSIGPSAKPAIGALESLAQDEQQPSLQRQAAIEAMARIDFVRFEPWLQHQNSSLRHWAFAAVDADLIVAAVNQESLTPDRFIELCSSGPAELQIELAEAIERPALNARLTAQQLKRLLQQSNFVASLAAAQVLGRRAHVDDETLQALRWLLGISELYVDPLMQISPSDVDQLLDDSNPKVRNQACAALINQWTSDSESISALIDSVDRQVASLDHAQVITLIEKGNPALHRALSLWRGPIGIPDVQVQSSLLTLREGSSKLGAALACWYLRHIDPTSETNLQMLTDLLSSDDEFVQLVSARGIVSTSTPSDQAIETLVRLLDSSNELVRGAAEHTLYTWPHALSPLTAVLVRELDRGSLSIAKRIASTAAQLDIQDTFLRQALFRWLIETGEDHFEDILAKMDSLTISQWSELISPYWNSDLIDRSALRYYAIIQATSKHEDLKLIRYLDLQRPLPDVLPDQEAHRLLDGCADAWQTDPSRQSWNDDVVRRGREIIRNLKENNCFDLTRLSPQTVAWLDGRQIKTESYSKVSQEASLQEVFHWAMAHGIWFIAAHLAFWVGLIWLYPRSPKVQAFFFWNPWVRRIGGLGYVGVAIAWVPWLRQRMFAPFRVPLLSDAFVDQLDRESFFAERFVTDPRAERALPIEEVLEEFRGQFVLEGESGLGKSMYLRHLAANARQVTVYLPADRCAGGVLPAIQRKLQGWVGDESFLSHLVYCGTIDVMIDGLNEVDPDTRSEIRRFVEEFYHCNVLVATQPIAWKTPSTMRRLVLQPLTPENVERFLISRRTCLPPASQLDSRDFEFACRRFLQDIYSTTKNEDDLLEYRKVLSNPMDLTTVAHLIAMSQQPDLLRLQQQQYEAMEQDYCRQHINKRFPLAAFSEMVYQMRLTDQSEIAVQRYQAEIQCMQEHKLIVSRTYAALNATSGTSLPSEAASEQALTSMVEAVLPHKSWYFRHDKIMEFFIVQAFLADEKRPQQHLGDPRFRGVYRLLASLLTPAAAETLKQQIIAHSVQHQDISLLSDFEQFLQSRRGAA